MDCFSSKIGIIGGAGPTAGSLLFEKIIQICQTNYGCTRDADFPYVLLLSYPFTDMLTEQKNEQVIKNELESCFTSFLDANISIAAIACNTLHAFLPTIPTSINFVHMIKETEIFLSKDPFWENPLILCTSTSAQTKIHANFFPCRYPNPSLQKELDKMIDRITLGTNLHNESNLLNQLLLDNEPIILGCTELSLLNERAPLKTKFLCDPNTLVAKKICRVIYPELQPELQRA